MSAPNSQRKIGPHPHFYTSILPHPDTESSVTPRASPRNLLSGASGCGRFGPCLPPPPAPPPAPAASMCSGWGSSSTHVMGCLPWPWMTCVWEETWAECVVRLEAVVGRGQTQTLNPNHLESSIMQVQLLFVGFVPLSITCTTNNACLLLPHQRSATSNSPGPCSRPLPSTRHHPQTLPDPT